MNVEEKASEVIAKWKAGDPNRTAGLFITDLLHLHELIRDAIAAMRPPKDHIIDETGAVRRVLGTLPVTKDGVVVMPGHEVFHPEQDPVFHLEVMALHHDTDSDPEFPLPDDCEYIGHYSYWERETGYSQYESYDVRDCYSTRAAAEAARGVNA